MQLVDRTWFATDMISDCPLFLMLEYLMSLFLDDR